MKEKILLRTMTLKSVFNQGKYINKTVNDVFVNDISYLTYVYYNIEKLTFTTEVLKAIGIPKALQFKKPGINRELHKEYRHLSYKKVCAENAARRAKMSKLAVMKEISHNIKYDRIMRSVEDQGLQSRSIYFERKAKLQGRNHGR